MPSTVNQLFQAAGLHPAGVVRWRTAVAENGPGNYIVALTKDANTLNGALSDCPLDHGQLGHLLDQRPELRVAGSRPSVGELASLLEAFWMPDEVALYIGLAGTSLRRRVSQYYGTPLGAKRPHAGGWWLKTLSALDELWVHYAPTPENDTAEVAMLQQFATGVSATSLAQTPDITNPAPFANLRTGRGDNKAHGITGATGELQRQPTTPSRFSSPRSSSAQPELGRQGTPGGSLRSAAQAAVKVSQRVTANDLPKVKSGSLAPPRSSSQANAATLTSCCADTG